MRTTPRASCRVAPLILTAFLPRPAPTPPPIKSSDSLPLRARMVNMRSPEATRRSLRHQTLRRADFLLVSSLLFHYNMAP